MSPRPVVLVTCAAFRPERKAALDRLLAELRPQCSDAGIELFVYEDHEGKGSLGPWLRVLEYATTSNATHATYLPDDAVLVPHFVEVLRAAIAGQPEAILCFQSNHMLSPQAHALGARWYTTPDGFTAFGGTMPIPWVREHLQWRRNFLRPDILVQGDEGVNIWAMATGRLIHKSLPSLVDHDTGIPSADGNDHHEGKSPRRPLVWDPTADLRAVDWTGPVVHLGRTYHGNSQWLITKLRTPMARRAYEIARDGPRVPVG